MIFGHWLVWVYGAFALIAGVLMGFTARGLVDLLSTFGRPLTRYRGWMVLPVSAMFFVWLPIAYHFPMSYVPYGFIATVTASIIILY